MKSPLRFAFAVPLLAALLVAVVPRPVAAQSPAQLGLSVDRPIGTLEVVATFPGPMPTGVTVSRSGRVFVCFPRLGDAVDFTVGEVLPDGSTVPYPPGSDLNDFEPAQAATRFVSVQSVVIDAQDRLWAVDTGIPGPDMLALTGGPKLVAIDLNTNAPVRTIPFPSTVLGMGQVNDVRFDLTRGVAGIAYVTDAAPTPPNGILLVDLASGSVARRLGGNPTVVGNPDFRAVFEGRQYVMQRTPDSPQMPVTMGTDGIALSPDGGTLYYRPLASRRLYAVNATLLGDFGQSEEAIAATVRDLGEVGLADGLETDAQGRVYLTSPEYDAVRRFDPATAQFETLAHTRRILWPDTLSLATDGSLYVTTSQLGRMSRNRAGRDERERPFSLFRIQTDGVPARR